MLITNFLNQPQWLCHRNKIIFLLTYIFRKLIMEISKKQIKNITIFYCDMSFWCKIFEIFGNQIWNGSIMELSNKLGYYVKLYVFRITALSFFKQIFLKSCNSTKMSHKIQILVIHLSLFKRNIYQSLEILWIFFVLEILFLYFWNI